jgi:hypothetical protein
MDILFLAFMALQAYTGANQANASRYELPVIGEWANTFVDGE